MFVVAGGYLGISPVGPGTANVCFLCRTIDLRAAGRAGEGVLSRIVGQHPRLAGWLGELEPEGAFLSTSDIRFGLRSPSGPALPVGDAMGAIPPLVGDGIAMAMRSAELAAPLLSRHLSDELTWDRVRADYTRAWRREFGRRMRVARAVHEIAARPAGARAVVAVMRRAPGLLDWLVRSTRDWDRSTGDGLGTADVLASGRR
jgi:flavin-dependent dehydrogenase